MWSPLVRRHLLTTFFCMYFIHYLEWAPFTSAFKFRFKIKFSPLPRFEPTTSVALPIKLSRLGLKQKSNNLNKF